MSSLDAETYEHTNQEDRLRVHGKGRPAPWSARRLWPTRWTRRTWRDAWAPLQKRRTLRLVRQRILAGSEAQIGPERYLIPSMVVSETLNRARNRPARDSGLRKPTCQASSVLGASLASSRSAARSTNAAGVSFTACRKRRWKWKGEKAAASLHASNLPSRNVCDLTILAVALAGAAEEDARIARLGSEKSDGGRTDAQ